MNKINLRGTLSLILISVLFFSLGSFSLIKNFESFDNNCSYCITEECMNYDMICGDFGFYWWWVIGSVTLFAIGSSFIILAFPIRETNKEKTK